MRARPWRVQYPNLPTQKGRCERKILFFKLFQYKIILHKLEAGEEKCITKVTDPVWGWMDSDPTLQGKKTAEIFQTNRFESDLTPHQKKPCSISAKKIDSNKVFPTRSVFDLTLKINKTDPDMDLTNHISRIQIRSDPDAQLCSGN